MASMLASSAVVRGFKSRFVVSVSEHYKNQTKRVGLVQSGPHHHFIEINLFSP
jgi:hypothetical protein